MKEPNIQTIESTTLNSRDLNLIVKRAGWRGSGVMRGSLGTLVGGS